MIYRKWYLPFVRAGEDDDAFDDADAFESSSPRKNFGAGLFDDDDDRVCLFDDIWLESLFILFSITFAFFRLLNVSKTCCCVCGGLFKLFIGFVSILSFKILQFGLKEC